MLPAELLKRYSIPSGALGKVDKGLTLCICPLDDKEQVKANHVCFGRRGKRIWELVTTEFH